MSYEGMGTNGASSSIRPVTIAEEVVREEPTDEERAQAEHDRAHVENRIEEAGNVLRSTLRFFRPSTHSGDAYAGLGIIFAGIVLLPAVAVGGYVGRKRGAMWKGAAAGVGTVIATAVVAKPVAILATGRRNPIADAINAVVPRDTRPGSGLGFVAAPLALSAALGYLGSRLATRTATTAS